jgi:predicted Zn finger-like uncharacterized protein
MNNACPSCGAVYAVAAKDIGRKIKCKKCGTALVVEDDGLVVDPSKAPPAAVAAAVEDDTETFDTDDDEVGGRRRKGKKGQRDRQPGPGMDFGAVLAKAGGIPTILFTIGVALVIWYFFMPRIGQAAERKAAATPQRLEMDMANRLQAALPKGKESRAELNEEERKKYDDEAKKIDEDFKPKIREAKKEEAETRVDNTRDLKGERYGTMFGFLFMAFGCIGFLKTVQPLTVQIVAGVILTLMMIVVFIMIGAGGV